MTRNSVSSRFRLCRLAVVMSAMVASSSLLAEDAVNVPAAQAPIVSAPSVKASLPLDAAVAAVPNVQGKAPVAELEADVPWVLANDLHPMPLRFMQPNMPTLGYIDLPSIPEVRVMLPGKALDEAGRIRGLIGRGLTNAIGLAAQHRGRQMEHLDSWIASTEKMARQVKASNDPWQQYAFNKELRQELTQFRAAIAGQSQASIQSLANESNRAVQSISPIMSAAQGYDQSTAWYGVLKQLQEGMTMYQAQVHAADNNLLNRIDDFLGMHPAVARPVGDPPPDTRGQPVRPVEPKAPVTKLQATPLAEQAKPATPVAPDNTGGLIVMAGIVGVIGFLVMRFRKKRGTANSRVDPSGS